MKNLFLTFYFLVCTISSHGQTDQKVADLINTENYLEMSRVYPSLKDSLAYPMIGIMAEVGMSCSFNKPAQAVVLIDSMLRAYSEDIGFETACSYTILKGLQLSKLGRYKEAAQSLKTMADNCDEGDMLNLLNSQYNTYNNLRNTPKSEIIRDYDKSNIIKMVTDIKGAEYSWYIPIEINGVKEPFLFDTGASQTMISASFAKKHNVKVVADSVLMTNALGENIYTGVGVVDTLKIGNITYTNVRVGIVDNLMPTAAVDKLGFTLDAVIGVPFMEAVGSIKIRPLEMEIEFCDNLNNNTEESTPSNIINFSGAIVVESFYDNLRMFLVCDTGAAETEGEISSNIYLKNKDLFENLELKKDSVQVGGANSKLEKKYILSISNLPLKIGGTPVMNYNNFYIMENNHYNGMLGVKFFKKHKEIIFDLNKMVLILQ